MRTNCPHCDKPIIIKHGQSYVDGDDEVFVCEECKQKYKAIFYLEVYARELNELETELEEKK
jgi:predicted Zn finger-like uncharacterized protein